MERHPSAAAAALLVLLSAFVVLTELGLRLAGAPGLTPNERYWLDLYGPGPSFVRGADGTYRLSEELTRLDNSPRSFPERRRPGVPRVLCVGGSTTAGWPFHPYGGYPERLRLMLSDARGAPVDVVNGGIHAYSVREDVRVLRDISGADWDLIVAYEGHNLEYTADECKPGSLKRRLALSLWLTRHSYLYRVLGAALHARARGIEHMAWVPKDGDEAYRHCVARGLDAGLTELGRLAKDRGWKVLLAAPVHGADLWTDGEIPAVVARAAKREGFWFFDAQDYVRRASPVTADATIGDRVHPNLEAQGLIARGMTEALAADGWPSPGALAPRRLKPAARYRASLGMDAASSARMHARLGLFYVVVHPDRVSAEFTEAERLESGVLRSMVGEWSRRLELDAVIAYYDAHGPARAADELRSLRRSLH